MDCPFIESNNPHCGEHLTIQRLEDAFEYCTNHYQLCPIYLRLVASELEPVGAGAKTDNQGGEPRPG